MGFVRTKGHPFVEFTPKIVSLALYSQQYAHEGFHADENSFLGVADDT